MARTKATTNSRTDPRLATKRPSKAQKSAADKSKKKAESRKKPSAMVVIKAPKPSKKAKKSDSSEKATADDDEEKAKRGASRFIKKRHVLSELRRRTKPLLKRAPMDRIFREVSSKIAGSDLRFSEEAVEELRRAVENRHEFAFPIVHKALRLARRQTSTDRSMDIFQSCVDNLSGPHSHPTSKLFLELSENYQPSEEQTVRVPHGSITIRRLTAPRLDKEGSQKQVELIRAQLENIAALQKQMKEAKREAKAAYKASLASQKSKVTKPKASRKRKSKSDNEGEDAGNEAAEESAPQEAEEQAEPKKTKKASTKGGKKAKKD